MSTVSWKVVEFGGMVGGEYGRHDSIDMALRWSAQTSVARFY